MGAIKNLSRFLAGFGEGMAQARAEVPLSPLKPPISLSRSHSVAGEPHPALASPGDSSASLGYESITLTVSGPAPWGNGACQEPGGGGQNYLFWALVGMNVSLWGSHEDLGSIQIIKRGRPCRDFALTWIMVPPGEEITLAATGPDAQKALRACRRFLVECSTSDERRAMYREHYRHSFRDGVRAYRRGFA